MTVAMQDTLVDDVAAAEQAARAQRESQRTDILARWSHALTPEAIVAALRQASEAGQSLCCLVKTRFPHSVGEFDALLLAGSAELPMGIRERVRQCALLHDPVARLESTQDTETGICYLTVHWGSVTAQWHYIVTGIILLLYVVLLWTLPPMANQGQ